MTLDHLKHLATSLMGSFGLIERGWTFKVDYSTKGRRLGQCRMGINQIGISAWYAEGSSDLVVEDTIRHEIAHALAWIEFGDKSHGPVWKAMCKRTGANPERVKLAENIKPRSRYKAQCPQCLRVWHKTAKPRRGYYCRFHPPGSTRPLVWVDDREEFVRDTAHRAASRVSDVLSNHIDEVQSLIMQLGASTDPKLSKKIRSRLRKLGHKGGLS